MTRRARLRTATVLVAVALLVGAPTAAWAEGPTPSPTPTASASSAPAPTPAPTSATAAEAQRLAARIVALQRTAETKGEVAQKAGERANRLRAKADAAQRALVDAAFAAQAAQRAATASRARASALAARLARTDLGTLPLDLMLNGGSAQGVLSGLSTTGQLTAQAKLLYAKATADEQEAQRLRAVAAAAADDASKAADAAAKASKAAKKEAATAQRAVGRALAQQRALLAEDHDESDLCGAAGTTPVGACLTRSEAPAGSSIGEQVVAYSLRQIGKPYVFAAAGPDAYDCSGLTLAAYAEAGVSIGIHSATAQYRLAARQGDLVALADARPGDLLFYTDGGGDMYHVTVYAGNGLMIEAPYPGATVREAPVRTGDLVATAAHFG